MSAPKLATLYRMVMPGHTCPYGLKSLDLLKRKGYEVEDKHLASREQTDAFKKEHGVETTPQVFINGRRVGGYDDLRKFFGMSVKDKNAVTYTPVIALFAMAAAMALAASWAAFGQLWSIQAAEWFVAFAMCLLALQKLKDVDGFATMFLNYDLLAKRWVRYAYFYPFAEAIAGVLMVAGVGDVGCRFRCAVHRDRRGRVGFQGGLCRSPGTQVRLRGGDSNVPLGFVSLTENLMMVAMALWPRSGLPWDALSAAPGTAQRTCSHRPSCVHAGHDAVLLRARREASFAQGRGDLLLRGRGLDLDTAGRRVRDDLGVGVDRLDRFRHSAGAAAAGHVFEMELHGKLLSGWGV